MTALEEVTAELARSSVTSDYALYDALHGPPLNAEQWACLVLQHLASAVTRDIRADFSTSAQRQFREQMIRVAVLAIAAAEQVHP